MSITSWEMVQMMAMHVLRLCRPQAVVGDANRGSLLGTVKRRVGCWRWHPWMPWKTRGGAGDLAAHSLAEGREPAGGTGAADTAGWAAAVGGNGGAARALAAASRTGRGDIARSAAGDSDGVALRSTLAEVAAMAKRILLLLLLRVQHCGGGGGRRGCCCCLPHCRGGRRRCGSRHWRQPAGRRGGSWGQRRGRPAPCCGWGGCGL